MGNCANSISESTIKIKNTCLYHCELVYKIALEKTRIAIFHDADRQSAYSHIEFTYRRITPDIVVAELFSIRSRRKSTHHLTFGNPEGGLCNSAITYHIISTAVRAAALYNGTADKLQEARKIKGF